MQWGTDLPSNKNDPGKTGTLRSPENFSSRFLPPPLFPIAFEPPFDWRQKTWKCESDTKSYSTQLVKNGEHKPDQKKIKLNIDLRKMEAKSKESKT